MKLATYVERVPVCKYATSLTVTYDGSLVHGCTRITRVHRVRVCRTRIVSKLKAANFVYEFRQTFAETLLLETIVLKRKIGGSDLEILEMAQLE